MFPFPCPSVFSEVITCLYNRRAAQRDRTLVERRVTEVENRSRFSFPCNSVLSVVKIRSARGIVSAS